MAEWDRVLDPQRLLSLLLTQGRLSERKARLFAVACCRTVWHLLADPRGRHAVEVAERYADGLADFAELADAAAEAAAMEGVGVYVGQTRELGVPDAVLQTAEPAGLLAHVPL